MLSCCSPNLDERPPPSLVSSGLGTASHFGGSPTEFGNGTQDGGSLAFGFSSAPFPTPLPEHLLFDDGGFNIDGACGLDSMLEGMDSELLGGSGGGMCEPLTPLLQSDILEGLPIADGDIWLRGGC